MNYCPLKVSLKSLYFWDNLGYLRKLEKSIALPFTFLLGLSDPVSVSETFESKSQTWPVLSLTALFVVELPCQQH